MPERIWAMLPGIPPAPSAMPPKTPPTPQGRVLTGNPNTRTDSAAKRNTHPNANTNTAAAQMPNNAGVSLTTGLR